MGQRGRAVAQPNSARAGATQAAGGYNATRVNGGPAGAVTTPVRNALPHSPGHPVTTPPHALPAGASGSIWVGAPTPGTHGSLWSPSASDALSKFAVEDDAGSSCSPTSWLRDVSFTPGSDGTRSCRATPVGKAAACPAAEAGPYASTPPYLQHLHLCPKDEVSPPVLMLNRPAHMPSPPGLLAAGRGVAGTPPLSAAAPPWECGRRERFTGTPADGGQASMPKSTATPSSAPGSADLTPGSAMRLGSPTSPIALAAGLFAVYTTRELTPPSAGAYQTAAWSPVGSVAMSLPAFAAAMASPAVVDLYSTGGGCDCAGSDGCGGAKQAGGDTSMSPSGSPTMLAAAAAALAFLQTCMVTPSPDPLRAAKEDKGPKDMATSPAVQQVLERRLVL